MWHYIHVINITVFQQQWILLYIFIIITFLRYSILKRSISITSVSILLDAQRCLSHVTMPWWVHLAKHNHEDPHICNGALCDRQITSKCQAQQSLVRSHLHLLHMSRKCLCLWLIMSFISRCCELLLLISILSQKSHFLLRKHRSRISLWCLFWTLLWGEKCQTTCQDGAGLSLSPGPKLKEHTYSGFRKFPDLFNYFCFIIEQSDGKSVYIYLQLEKRLCWLLYNNAIKREILNIFNKNENKKRKITHFRPIALNPSHSVKHS